MKQPARFGYTWINLNSFIRKYSSVMPEDMFFTLQKASFEHSRIQITTSSIEELDRRLAVKKAEAKKLSQCAARNNKGKEYEKAGKIKQAIATYEKNIEGDCYPACRSFDRLMILYRKQKDYGNEVRVIEKAIKVLGKSDELYEKYSKRLVTARSLYAKELLNNKTITVI